jgi:hypothetical protein
MFSLSLYSGGVFKIIFKIDFIIPAKISLKLNNKHKLLLYSYIKYHDLPIKNKCQFLHLT